MSEVRRSLREQLRLRRTSIPAAARIAAAAAVAEHLLRLPQLQQSRYVAGYWAIGGELPLNVVMSRLPESARYCLPLLQAGGTLRFGPWRVGDALVANRYGIPEPAQPPSMVEPGSLDVVLLPLLGFTRAGDRLGTGGGWYDRSFAFRRSTTAPPLLVGVGFACQQIDACDTKGWDVPLDAIVTEEELLVCKKGAE